MKCKHFYWQFYPEFHLPWYNVSYCYDPKDEIKITNYWFGFGWWQFRYCRATRAGP